MWPVPSFQSSVSEAPALVSLTRVLKLLLICRFSRLATTGDRAAAKAGLLVTAPLGKATVLVAITTPVGTVSDDLR